MTPDLCYTANIAGDGSNYADAYFEVRSTVHYFSF
jgi:hypothetical protein